MTTVEKQKAKMARMLEAMAKEQAKLLMTQRADARKKQREGARAKAKEKAALFRSADAHRKIVLGGLVIAAEVDTWDTAEIVGALLLVAERIRIQEGLRGQLREKGISHLEQRKAARAAA
jgi:hypothetical protein